VIVISLARDGVAIFLAFFDYSLYIFGFCNDVPARARGWIFLHTIPCKVFMKRHILKRQSEVGNRFWGDRKISQ